ncbi:MAG: IS200/IS605 family transposase [Pedobacter sp.]|uniref:IS200/IS605 family transposase n=1 Tax=Pedobacter sp. TaxID=1411316 RepID=UPI00280A238D|nr:IS200/IS605 family transposase [Pedobacter sp.]MDQ8005854.1 IS200/IS605 family transposase [Pedobacter sp.]
MANTYSQINIHCVFAVKGRENIITQNFRDDLHKYMSGVLKNDNVFPLAVGGWKDHVHVFFELLPNLKISDIIRNLKSVSSKWINDNHFVLSKFQWQEGYGAFSYSRSQRNDVINYIINQEEHHRGKTFREEYLEMLKKFEVEFKDEYVFDFYE